MDTHKYKYIAQEAAKDLSVIESNSHPKIGQVRLLGVSGFYVDSDMLRIDQTWACVNFD